MHFKFSMQYKSTLIHLIFLNQSLYYHQAYFKVNERVSCHGDIAKQNDCAQPRLKSAWAYAQSDQSLCFAPIETASF